MGQCWLELPCPRHRPLWVLTHLGVPNWEDSGVRAAPFRLSRAVVCIPDHALGVGTVPEERALHTRGSSQSTAIVQLPRDTAGWVWKELNTRAGGEGPRLHCMVPKISRYFCGTECCCWPTMIENLGRHCSRMCVCVWGGSSRLPQTVAGSDCKFEGHRLQFQI